jgi:hypothetical protein
MNRESVADQNGGLTPEEAAVMDALVDATNRYNKLPPQHPSEGWEWADSVHKLQQLLAIRVARREYPGYWSDASRQ